MPYDPLSKYQIVESPLQQLPHKCAACGTPGEQQPCEARPATKFFTFGLEIEFFGVVYICEACFTGMANQLDYHSPAQFNKLDDMFKRVDQINFALREENQELKNAVAALNNVLSLGTVAVVDDRVVNPEVRTEESADTTDESESDNDESGSDEQIDVEGYSGVSDDDGIDELLKFDI